ncbi:MAG: hypothetical protein M3Z23_15270 [Acidobacteriota bacterium]|nr:hypothetical protein [Acidobacteriota bacterium]
MTRRVLLATLTTPLFAGSQEVLDTLTAIASALSAGNAIAFLKPFDRGMPEFDEFSGNVIALVDQAEIICSIDILTESGDDENRTAKLDWLLQLKPNAPNARLERRRQIVTVQLSKRGGKWKIVAFDPMSILAPMKLG